MSAAKKRIKSLAPALEERTESAWREVMNLLEEILEPAELDALLDAWADGIRTELAERANRKAGGDPRLVMPWEKFLKLADALEQLEELR